jgi:Fur family iron response transcriptional regulator
MSNENTAFEVLIRKANLRPTKQRIALARALFADGNRHVTAEQLHEEVSSKENQLSLATVYNNLHQFTKAGLLREVFVDSSKTHFDTNTTSHHHFYFEDEGRLEDIQTDGLQLLKLPKLPADTEISAIDIVVRMRSHRVK